MKIYRIDHVSIVVNDLQAAKAFYSWYWVWTTVGGEIEGEWMDQVIGLKATKQSTVALGLPDGQNNLELIKFYTPLDKKGVPATLFKYSGYPAYCICCWGYRGYCYQIAKEWHWIFSEIVNYENTYKLCYFRGPEGIILELAEQIK